MVFSNMTSLWFQDLCSVYQKEKKSLFREHNHQNSHALLLLYIKHKDNSWKICWFIWRNRYFVKVCCIKPGKHNANIRIFLKNGSSITNIVIQRILCKIKRIYICLATHISSLIKYFLNSETKPIAVCQWAFCFSV